ncbi:MAG TPA: signal peptidase I [Abditibacteriaceae bacterium]|jgi:signal peptidase I
MSTVHSTKSSKLVAYLIEGAILVLALVLVLAIRFAVYEPALVISRSMEPSLLIDDRLLIDHRNSLHGTWRRGDIVLFAAPNSWNNEPSEDVPVEDRDQLIKRIIGLPGEKVDVFADQVWINGRLLAESYIKPSAPRPGEDIQQLRPISVTLGTGQYFVMGDNRGNSEDSRIRGPIGDRDIIGRAVRVFWPWGRSGGLTVPDYKQ